ncbi:hypothetical protein [Pararhizobium sp. O133]|uniref:hypothetical protein n=1 Tax=Pararhizobium sp. O133 TaxID=3449278 RepID=UPI003F6896A8
MTSARIDFKTDAATFNKLRDEWRSVAASCALPKAGFRVAGVLPTFVNREYGFAFPSDEEIASAIGTNNTSTAKRGLIALGEFNLIDRVTSAKRNEQGIVIGKLRRIYLKMPEPKVQTDENHVSPKVHFDDQPKVQNAFEPKVQKPKVQPQPKVQNPATEGSPGCTNILDRNTLDKDSAYDRKDKLEDTYTRTAPSVGIAPSVEEKKAQPQTEPSVIAPKVASSPAPEPIEFSSSEDDEIDLESVPDDEGDFPGDVSPPPKPKIAWQDWKHPKSLQGRPLSRKPFPAPKTLEAAFAFLRKHNVPDMERPKLLPLLMHGDLFEFDLEPWMDAG